ncbi:MAG: hypothetical protein AAF625_13990 [Pseudomonadota bacterium]
MDLQLAVWHASVGGVIAVAASPICLDRVDVFVGNADKHHIRWEITNMCEAAVRRPTILGYCIDINGAFGVTHLVILLARAARE